MKSRKAYSLAQLIVVVAIMAIIALIAIPLLSRFYQLYQFRTTMDQFVNDIRAARQAAITRGAPVRVSALAMVLW